MSKSSGQVLVICGTGNGKTSAALGKGIVAIGEGKTVYVIQLLKGKGSDNVLTVLKRLEPDMKVFTFEKSKEQFADLDEKQKEEELINIRNAIGFAKKVIATGSCDVMILDEILGLTDQGILSVDDLAALLKSKPDDMQIILTGKVFPKQLLPYVDMVSTLESTFTSQDI